MARNNQDRDDLADELGMSRFRCPNCGKLDYSDGDPECSRCGWTARPSSRCAESPDEPEEDEEEDGPKLPDLGAQLFATACAINRVATMAARQDPGVLPVLRKLDCKVAKLTAPELLASIKPEVRDAE